MPEPTLARLFRQDHVAAIALRLSSKEWDYLHSREFHDGLERLRDGRLTGEANTREKVVEPVLCDVLGFQRNENDSEHAIQFAGAAGGTGGVEYFFRIAGQTVPIETKEWGKSLDSKDTSGRSPVRQGWDYAGLSNSRWFIVTNGQEWRLYKKELRGSESPLSACERYTLDSLLQDRETFGCFIATFRRQAFVPDVVGTCTLDELRRKHDKWQESISERLYVRLVDARLVLYREIQPQFAELPQAQVNEAVVKLLFRIMFIFFAEDTPLLTEKLLHRGLIQQHEFNLKWGMGRGLYSYIQQYFAWLDGREGNGFGIYPYDGALFDPDPVLDSPQLRIDDAMLRRILGQLSEEVGGRSLDYSQINPRILGNIYEQFLGYVIEIKEGRIDPHAARDTRKREGSFYTPESVTRFLVEHCVELALAENPGRKPWELRCLDAACGSGHFLVEYVNHVARLSEQLDDSRSFPQWKRYVTEHCAFGVDKDSTAVMLTKLSLWINSAMKDEPFAVVDTHVKCGNSLVCAAPSEFRLADFEKKYYPAKYRELKKLRKDLAKLEGHMQQDRRLLSGLELQDIYRNIRHALLEIEELKAPPIKRFSDKLRQQWPSVANATPFHWRVEFAEVFEENGGFDVMVGNPPWGADLLDIADFLESGVFEVARGQYDSYELFVELGRRVLHDHGAFGFIIPDSITLPEHEPLRRMLLDHAALTRLVRLGEGIFPTVYRAAFLICFANHAAPRQQEVRVATVRKDDRKLLERDTLFDELKTIAQIVNETGHETAQNRFAGNPRTEFDILTSGRDEPIAQTIDANTIHWPDIMTTGRGVEMTKTGEVLQCPFCYRWDNLPKKSKGRFRPKVCRHCDRRFTIDEAARRETIVAAKRKDKDWRPFLVGESINRYHVTNRLWIDVSKDGLKYKAEDFYRGKRLLVRKTGVGIMATIDSSSAYTNQVVFTWKLRDGLEGDWAKYRLEYVLAALNSRMMLYRQCTKTGETEWRSFPYLTQKTIQQLPIRAIDFSNRRERELHDEIADRVETIVASGKPPTDHEDYQIEKLVMQLYGITRPMCRRIFEVLGQVQRLRVIREMNIARPDMLLDALPE